MARRKKKKFIAKKHTLMPKHVKLSEKDKKSLLEKYHINLKELPKILATDPAIQALGAKSGDVIKIVRHSPTAGEINFYRGVANE
ncbi:DNA-directed RNA polymerase subunit H [Candidatus Woesearchaeota archaeon]|nr:DNA-directed RNA polymerase subunit H [Candidatus Woesearchaeota archaeon]